MLLPAEGKGKYDWAAYMPNHWSDFSECARRFGCPEPILNDPQSMSGAIECLHNPTAAYRALSLKCYDKFYDDPEGAGGGPGGRGGGQGGRGGGHHLLILFAMLVFHDICHACWEKWKAFWILKMFALAKVRLYDFPSRSSNLNIFAYVLRYSGLKRFLVSYWHKKALSGTKPVTF
ncbi:hypothetical protein Tco_1209008 [Tanacetum coccineum]